MKRVWLGASVVVTAGLFWLGASQQWGGFVFLGLSVGVFLCAAYAMSRWP